MSVENPGSLVKFAEISNLDPVTALHSYSEAVHQYRRKLAEDRNITLDELHEIIDPISLCKSGQEVINEAQ